MKQNVDIQLELGFHISGYIWNFTNYFINSQWNLADLDFYEKLNIETRGVDTFQQYLFLFLCFSDTRQVVIDFFFFP